MLKREIMEPTNDEGSFNVTQAVIFAKELAFPRKTGTDGQVKAAEKIIGLLRELGYKVEEEHFSILLPPWVWFNGFPFISLILLGAPGSLSNRVHFLPSLFRLPLSCGSWVGTDFGFVSEDGSYRRTQVVAFVQRIFGQLFKALRIRDLSFFVTHYDRKSQYLNLFARAGCLLLGSLSTGIFSLWVLIGVSRIWMGSTSVTLPTWIQGCFFLTVGLNILFIFTRNGNGSDGAVDNASGVGILLKGARLLREIPPKNIAPVFLFTDAEEFGLLGSLMFQRMHGTDMVKRQAWVIIPFLKGIMMDHHPFGRVGIPALSLTNVSEDGWHLHTPRDRFSLLDERGLEEMGKFFLATVQWLDTGKKEWHVVSRRQTGNVAPHGRWARYQACLW